MHKSTCFGKKSECFFEKALISFCLEVEADFSLLMHIFTCHIIAEFGDANTVNETDYWCAAYRSVN